MNYRTVLIRAMTFLGGIYFFLKFVLPKEFTLGGEVVKLGAYNDQATAALVAVSSMALGLGLVNLLVVHGSSILYLRRSWPYSAALLGGLALMLTLSAYDWRESLRMAGFARALSTLSDFSRLIPRQFKEHTAAAPAHVRQRKLVEACEAKIRELEALAAEDDLPVSYERKELHGSLARVKELLARLELQPLEQPRFEVNGDLAAALGDLGAKTRALLDARYRFSAAAKFYHFIFQGIFVALGSAMFSLLGFYIASAAYRAFRVRSFESALMMTAALLVILGQIPFALFGSGEWGQYLQGLFPKVRLWLLTVPNSAAFRAIIIGSEIAGLVMALRMWLSIEAGSFAEKK